MVSGVVVVGSSSADQIASTTSMPGPPTNLSGLNPQPRTLTVGITGGVVGDSWYTGNANDDAGDYRGWLMGHFVEPKGGVRASTAVEVKWGLHPEGDTRDAWTVGEVRPTMLLLVSGRFRLDLKVGSTVLERQGDYVVWGPGIDHSWQAEEESVVLTVRWPSI